jgi:hypothetical protein
VPRGEGEDGPRKLREESELSMEGGGAGRGGGSDDEAAKRLSVSAFAIKPSRSEERDETKLLTVRLKCVVRSDRSR